MEKTVEFSNNIFMDLHELDELLPKLRIFKNKFHIEVKLSLGGPLELLYDDERYFPDFEFGDICFYDSRNKGVVLLVIEENNCIRFDLPDGVTVLKINKL